MGPDSGAQFEHDVVVAGDWSSRTLDDGALSRPAVQFPLQFLGTVLDLSTDSVASPQAAAVGKDLAHLSRAVLLSDLSQFLLFFIAVVVVFIFSGVELTGAATLGADTRLDRPVWPVASHRRRPIPRRSGFASIA